MLIHPDTQAFLSLVLPDVKLIVGNSKNLYGYAKYSQNLIMVNPLLCGSFVEARLTLCHEIAHFMSRPIRVNGRWSRHGQAWKFTMLDIVKCALDLGLFAEYSNSVNCKITYFNLKACGLHFKEQAQREHEGYLL